MAEWFEGNKDYEEKVDQVLTRGVAGVFVEEHLRERLLNREPLVVTFGIDPTGKRLHAGRTATMLKVRDFVELGSQIQTKIIIGTFTAGVGDPSDKSAVRRSLSRQEILENQEGYIAQIGRVIPLDKVEFVDNSTWFDGMNISDAVALGRQATLQHLLTRDNFRRRMADDKPVYLHETVYPLLQAWDKVVTESEVEIGGTDQTFALQEGRRIQTLYGQPPQDFVLTHLLPGTDGEKMSTTAGNCIWIDDPPDVMAAKVFGMGDEQIPLYMECATRLPMDSVNEAGQTLFNRGDMSAHKKLLAEELIGMYWI